MADTGTGTTQSHLLRVLSTAFGVAVVVGGTIGQGIMRTPGIVAHSLPSAKLILLLWLVGGAIAFIDAMSSIELASSIRLSGGPYVFTRRAFGDFVGLAVGMTDWLGNVAAIAYIAVVFSEYVHRLGIATALPVGVLAALLPVVTGLIHWFGTRVGGASQEIGSAVKAFVYMALILALLLMPRGAPVIAPAHAVAFGWLGAIAAVRAVVGAYGGWNAACYFTEEMTDPRRAIVRSTFTGLVAVVTVYLLMNVALLRTMTPAEMAGSTLVAADAAARLFGGAPGAADMLVTTVSLISVATIANVMVMQFPRVLYAIARDARVPVLSDVAPNGSPRAALAITALLGAALALVGIYEVLLGFSLVLLMGMAAMMNASAIVMRLREPDLERPYRMPLFPLPAAFAMTVNLLLLAAFVYEDSRTAASAVSLLMAITFVVWLATRRHARLQAVG